MLFSTCLFVYDARNSLSRCSKFNSTKIVVRWGSAPDPTGGAHSAPPDPLAGFKGPTPKAPTRKGRGGEDPEKLCTPKNSLE